MKRLYYTIVGLFLLQMLSINVIALTKFEKWQQPSFFRGFDMTYYCPVSDCVREQQDFYELKNTGANLAQINIYGESFRNIEFPYDINIYGIKTLTTMVNYCRNADLYYIIAVRVGPGRYDVSDEMPSFVWHPDSSYAASMYGKMLREIAEKFYDDTLFVGLNLMVEPTPLGDLYTDPEELDSLLKINNFDLFTLYKNWIDSIRTAAKNLPVIVQAAQFSDPEYWSTKDNSFLLRKQADPYVIYDFHTYQPFDDYTHAETMNSATYPVKNVWNETIQQFTTWDSTLFSNVVFSKVKAFQEKYNVPIFMGEFGMMLPQNNGETYMNDIYEIAVNSGWHFALWSWSADKDPAQYNFDYKKFDNFSPGSNYWETVLKMFNNITSIEKTAKNDNIDLNVFPNPINESSVIQYYNPESGIVKLSLYDILGSERINLFNGFQQYGNHSLILYSKYNFQELSSGMYFLKLQTNKGIKIQRLVISK